MEPASTRVEIDLPIVILNQYGHMELDNHKDVSDILAQFFPHRSVITLHIVAESTGESREVCTFIDPTSAYKSKCQHILSANGICWLEEQHEAARQKFAASQLPLEESD